MPNYDFGNCSANLDHSFEKFIPLTEWQDKMRIPCEIEGCTGEAQQVVLPRGAGCTISPFVYYTNAAGEVRVAADSRHPTPANHVRHEITNLHELRKFEKRLSTEERSKLANRKEYEDYSFQQEQNENRRELRSAMESMSAAGRDFAMAAMEKNNRKSRGYSHDPGVHLNILHNDERARRD